MLIFLFKRLITIAFFIFPFSSVIAQAQTIDDPVTALQTVGLTDHSWAIGDASVGGDYDTLLGVIWNARYAQSLGDDWALGLIGEYGPNQYRFNGTVGRALWENAEIKFTTDYLSQVLPFDFDSGSIDQRVHQTAYGFELQQDLQHSLFQNINFGGYRSASADVSLSNLTYISGDTTYTNQRNIAGAVAQGVDLGTELKLTSMTALDTKIVYDDIQYNTHLTEDSEDNAARFGGVLALQQVITDRLKMSFSSEIRAIYNTYDSQFSWAPEFGQHLGMRFALSAERLISHNQTPNSNRYGLELSLFNDDDTKSPNYDLSTSAKAPDLTEWVKDPAVYMQRVLATAEQKTTANEEEAPTVPTLTLARISVAGPGPVTYTTSSAIAWLGSDTAKYRLYNVIFPSASNAVPILINGYPLPTTVGGGNLGAPGSMTSTTMTSTNNGSHGSNAPYFASFICESGKTTYNTSYCTNYLGTN